MHLQGNIYSFQHLRNLFFVTELLVLHCQINILLLYYNQVNSFKLIVQFDYPELLFELWISTSVQLWGAGNYLYIEQIGVICQNYMRELLDMSIKIIKNKHWRYLGIYVN